MTFLIGADPEFFLKRNGVNISADAFVPGTKDNPYRLKNGAVQLDGTAVEFNIDPASTAEEFSYNICSVMDEIRKMIPSEITFDFSPSVIYTEDIWKSIPSKCLELGCNPDNDAYNNNKPKVPPPLPEKFKRMRTGAGHIHIGWGNNIDITDQTHIDDCNIVVKNLDCLFNHYSRCWDNDNRRHILYGQPGSFRIKPYGVEYRVLSNAWLRYPDLWPWLFNNTQCTLQKLLNGDINLYLLRYSYIHTYDALNNHFKFYLGEDFTPFSLNLLNQRKAA